MGRPRGRELLYRRLRIPGRGGATQRGRRARGLLHPPLPFTARRLSGTWLGHVPALLLGLSFASFGVLYYVRVALGLLRGRTPGGPRCIGGLSDEGKVESLQCGRRQVLPFRKGSL